MRCANCCKELKKISYYKAKTVCKDCFERLRYKDKHCSEEELKKISLMRSERRREVLGKNRIDNPQSQKVYECLPCKKGKGN